MSDEVKVLFVEWCAKEALEGTQLLEPMEELAYRRVLDFIYSTNDQLPDDDKRLARLTKTGRQWKAIKQTLIAFGKIEVKNGFLTNKKCTSKIELAKKNIAQKKAAGEASARKRNALKNNETGSTAVATDDQTPDNTAAPAAEATNQKPIKKKKINKKRKGTAKEHPSQQGRGEVAQPEREPPDKPDTSPPAKPEKPWFSGQVIVLNRTDFMALQRAHGGGNTAFMAYLSKRDSWYVSQSPAKQKGWRHATFADLNADPPQSTETPHPQQQRG